MTVHAILEDLAALVDSSAFKEAQELFFAKYCNELDAGDNSTENKLAYTSIHNEYVSQVEGSIVAHIGEPAMKELMGGLEGFLQSDDHPKSAAVARALDILDSMGDYEAFKQTMLSKRASQEEGGGTRDFGQATVVDLEGSLELCGRMPICRSARTRTSRAELLLTHARAPWSTQS